MEPSPVDPLNVRHSQSGLGYFPDHAVYATFFLTEPQALTKARWQALVRELDVLAHEDHHQTVALCGVGPDLWRTWADTKHPAADPAVSRCSGLKGKEGAFAATGGDLWFHIKGPDPARADALLQAVQRALDGLVRTDKPAPVVAQKRHGGRVLGGRFIDGMENPADREDLSARVVLGPEHGEARGGAFLVSQRFEHDWTQLDAMLEQQKQNMIGRDGNDRILAIDDESSHIKRARHVNGERMNARLVRQALPYGQATANRANEQGVMFAGYAQSVQMLDAIFEQIAGSRPGFVQDQLFSVTHGVEGSYFYLPSRAECGLAGEAAAQGVTMNPFFDTRSDNGYMFYNARDYQHRVRRSKLVDGCPISERILTLLNKQFSRWQDTWYRPRETPAMGKLDTYVKGTPDESVLAQSVTLRKGLATRITLSKVVVDPEYARRANLMRVDPDELIVGNMPQLSLGTGSQVIEYLNDDERVTQWFGMLNEYAATGHNVPDYALLLREGIGGLLKLYQQRMAAAGGDQPRQEFFQSALWALQGLQAYVGAHAAHVETQLADAALPAAQRSNLQGVLERLQRLGHQPAGSFVEGLQLIFLTNCALHLMGEPHSIGRLDQLLIGLYEADLARDALTPAQAQEAIDAFWLKMDETVLYNYRHLNDYLTYGTGAVFYAGSNFPQGAAINQWVQQVTVGGLKGQGGPAQDASNAVTRMCLRAARRLPLNAPCLSLRVHAGTPPDVLEEAAKALLSGGAHPVLLNDDRLVPALEKCMPATDPAQRLADARDFSCDGCYEPVIPGRTEWAFNYVPLLPMVEFALNQGTTIQQAGPINLRGNKLSWNSPPPEEIESFEHFLDIFQEHWRWAVAGYFHSLMLNYGSLAQACPSPLFSALMTDAADTGRDLTAGGARYHVVALMMCGIGDAIDSLFAIKKLVFDADTARCSLPELLRCLQCDWGYNMQPPFFATSAGGARLEEEAERYQQLRQAALALPKFGIDGTPELVALAESVIAKCIDTIHAGLDGPKAVAAVKQGYETLKSTYSLPGRPFAFTVTPGVGTFEDNVGVGMGMGASANGRRNAQPIASDFTAMPLPSDLPLPARTAPLSALHDWHIAPICDGLANAAPSDLNIAEDFPLDALVGFLGDFAQGRTGSNMVTISCASPGTLAAAMETLERYDLVRVRTGGWSEFFVSMFDFHQEYLRRRTYYTP